MSKMPCGKFEWATPLELTKLQMYFNTVRQIRKVNTRNKNGVGGGGGDEETLIEEDGLWDYFTQPDGKNNRLNGDLEVSTGYFIR